MKAIIPVILSILVGCENKAKVAPVVTADSAILVPTDDPIITTGVDTDDHNHGSYPTNTLDSSVPTITPADTVSTSNDR